MDHYEGMDIGIFRELRDVIATLTTSNEPLSVLSDHVKKLKAICKVSEVHIKAASSMLFHQLSRQNSLIRLSAVNVMDVLFTRSACFRSCVTNDMQTFLTLAVGSNPHQHLPLPRESAHQLQKTALGFIDSWNSKYGAAYKKLSLSHEFLRIHLRVDFLSLCHNTDTDHAQPVIEDPASRRQRMAEEIRKHEIARIQFNQVSEEMAIHGGAMLEYAKEANNCFELLGIRDNDEAKEIYENSDNAPILDTLRDLRRLIANRGCLKMTRRWSKIASRHHDGSEEDDAVMKSVIDLAMALRKIDQRCNVLAVYPRVVKRQDISNDNNSDDEGSLEDVPIKEGFEHFKDPDEGWEAVPTYLWSTDHCDDEKSQNSLVSISSDRGWSLVGKGKAIVNDDISTSVSSPSELANASLSDVDDDIKRDLYARAPVVPFGQDLYYFNKSSADLASEIEGLDGLHRFWVAGAERDHDNIRSDDERLNRLRLRTIRYNSEHKVRKWYCRAPISNGKLCSRQDHVKCPFHGVIKPRNALGIIALEAEDESLKSNTEENTVLMKTYSLKPPPPPLAPPTWQGIAADVIANLPVEERPQESQKKRRRKDTSSPPLTDIVPKKALTMRQRLQKRVLSVKALQRAAATQASVEDAKLRDKFGAQWQYNDF